MSKGLFDLTGKVALVTGGNGGIGLGMAKGLAMHGASVVIWGNKAEKNERAVARRKAVGGGGGGAPGAGAPAAGGMAGKAPRGG